GDDSFAELRKCLNEVQQIMLLGTPPVQGDHVRSEHGLQRGKAVELVQHHVGHGIALELYHNAITIAVRLVAHVRNALDPLLADEFGDALLEYRFVNLIGDFCNDQGIAVFADSLYVNLATNRDGSAALQIGGADARTPHDDTARGKIRPRHMLHELLGHDAGILQECQTGVDDFAEIVGGDVRRHADGNAASSVDEQVGKAGGKDGWFTLRIIVVLLEID